MEGVLVPTMLASLPITISLEMEGEMATMLAVLLIKMLLEMVGVLVAMLATLLKTITLVMKAVLALVLAEMMETNFRRALMGEGGDPTILVTSPISAGMLIVAAIVVFVPLFRMLSSRVRSRVATKN